MKKVDTSFISTTAGMMGRAGVLNHLMDAYTENANSIGRLVIGPEYLANKIYVLWGCVNSGSGLSYIFSAGAVFFNGEIFPVDAVSFVSPGGQVAVGNLASTFATSGIGDPVPFTDGSSHNVLVIRKIALASGASGSGNVTGDANSDFDSWLRVSQLKTERKLVSAFGGSQTINFRQDQCLFYTTGVTSGASTINWDFAGAIPGTVVRLKLAVAAGAAVSISTPAGSHIVQESGIITANKTNYVYFHYVGKDESGNDEVSYNVVSI